MLPILAEAVKELGYTEHPPGSNRTKFAAEAGHANGQPWCATFVVAMARRVGVKLPSESAYTPTMAAGFKGLQQMPRVGDLAFFNFPDSKDRIQHVGIVESIHLPNRTVTCIEANTSPGVRGSQDNGGGVYRRTRTFGHIVGFGRPSYLQESPMPDTPSYKVHARPVGIATTASGKGYYILCEDGGVFGFGDAVYFGRVESDGSWTLLS